MTSPKRGPGDPDVIVGVVEDLETPKRKRPRVRRTRVRSKTISPRNLQKAVRIGRAMIAFSAAPEHDGADRPKTRGDCRDDQRPCPWVSCKHHLYLDVNPETGSIKINFPDLEPWELKHTCSLDVAERGGITLEEVGEIANLTRERVRQIEVRGLLQLRRSDRIEAPQLSDSDPSRGWDEVG